MLDLQSLTDAWGNWFAGTLGTSLNWTESTNYGNHSELDGSHQYQVTATYKGINYDGNSPPTNASGVAYELWYDNNSDATQSNTFNYTSSTTQTFTWSITEGVSVGIEISATEGVPSVASSTQKLTVTLNFSATQTQTETATQTWSVNSPVQVPPRSSIKADMVINSQSYNINFTADVFLSGYVNVWFNDRVTIPGGDGEHFCWFIPISQVFLQIQQNLKNISTDGYTIGIGGVTTTARGVFTGSQGVSVGVSTTQYPPRSGLATERFAPTAKRSVLLGALSGPI